MGHRRPRFDQARWLTARADAEPAEDAETIETWSTPRSRRLQERLGELGDLGVSIRLGVLYLPLRALPPQWAVGSGITSPVIGTPTLF